MTDSILRPAPKPKPEGRGKRPPHPPKRSRIKRYNAKRRGRAFGAECRDDDFTAWMRTLPCAICAALGVHQAWNTEVEHWVPRSQGGRDKGDTFPTCAYHREVRHGGPASFAKILRVAKIAPKKLCKWYERQYEAEKFPCP